MLNAQAKVCHLIRRYKYSTARQIRKISGLTDRITLLATPHTDGCMLSATTTINSIPSFVHYSLTNTYRNSLTPLLCPIAQSVHVVAAWKTYASYSWCTAKCSSSVPSPSGSRSNESHQVLQGWLLCSANHFVLCSLNREHANGRPLRHLHIRGPEKCETSARSLTRLLQGRRLALTNAMLGPSIFHPQPIQAHDQIGVFKPASNQAKASELII